jgi:hypothetical protein
MNLAMPQSDTTCLSIERPRRGAWLRRSSLRPMVSRLRRRGPRWMLAALLLLLAADAVLAILAWLIIGHVVR